jgi:alpha/beta superfamily hydrolase
LNVTITPADLDRAAAFLYTAVGAALPLALLGYSFGCTLLSRAVLAAGRVPPRTTLGLVAPTVRAHDYASLEPVPNPKLGIAPEEDFAADPIRLRAWFDRLNGPKQLLQPRLDSHFFRGHEDSLRMPADVREALTVLFGQTADLGLIAAVPPLDFIEGERSQAIEAGFAAARRIPLAPRTR